MRFGIYAGMQAAPGKSHVDLTWEIFRQIEHADQVALTSTQSLTITFFSRFSISANQDPADFRGAGDAGIAF